IGREIALLFAAEGAAVVVTGRDPARGEAVVKSAADAGGTAAFVPSDLADPRAPEHLVAATVERFGRLTVLVNNAVETGIHDGPVTDVSDDAWERILDVNLLAVARLCRHAVPAMAAAGH